MRIIGTVVKTNEKFFLRLYYLLLKEDFRNFLIAKNASPVVIDGMTYSRLPNVMGCFCKKQKWLVYETDDYSRLRKTEQFNSQENAYRAIALRQGLCFDPAVSISLIRSAYLSIEKPDNEWIRKLRSAKQSLQTIMCGMEGTSSYSSIKEDYYFLCDAASTLEFDRYSSDHGIVKQRNLSQAGYRKVRGNLRMNNSSAERKNSPIAQLAAGMATHYESPLSCQSSLQVQAKKRREYHITKASKQKKR